MDNINHISGVIISPLNKIENQLGSILHGMKASENGYIEFGEAYFSTVGHNIIKPWKKHLKMTLNLIVPIGRVRFVFMDNDGLFREEIIGDGNYVRLTIPPGIWFGFKGDYENTSLILNIANIEHSPEEIERKEALEKFGAEGSGKNLPFSSLSEDLKKKNKKSDW